jgi:hypothetical protein
MERPVEFFGTPFRGTPWGVDDKPVLIVDGIKYPRTLLSEQVHGSFAYGVGLKDKEIDTLGRFLQVRSLRLYEIRASNLAPLSRVGTLRHLSLDWSTKLQDLNFLAELPDLEGLILNDLGKVDLIDGVAHLKHLRYLEITGGFNKTAKYKTLHPISGCEQLETLTLENIRVDDDDLQFLTSCTHLTSLHLSNQWPTEQYALLSKNLPNVQCRHFKPWLPLSKPLSGKDILVTGRGKPFLNSQTDQEKIRKYEEDFARMAT